jgi:membrane-bound lytic murein transglycosylase A
MFGMEFDLNPNNQSVMMLADWKISWPKSLMVRLPKASAKIPMLGILVMMLGLAACATVPRTAHPLNTAVSAPCATLCPAPVQCLPPKQIGAPPVVPNLRPATWADLPGWDADHQLEAWPAWLASCAALKNKPDWKMVCGMANGLNPVDDTGVRAYFETNFNVFQSVQADGGVQGLFTGYYAPVLQGSLVRTSRFSVPLYAPPPDLLSIDLSAVYPELKTLRLRGRLQGNQIVPYWSRSQIDGDIRPLAGHELVWLENPVDAFFLQIQGSGHIKLPDGKEIMVGYADQNGYPYLAIGRVLVERGDLHADQVSMQAIRDWGQAHPDQLPDLLAQNPSYVFFRILPDTAPLGALGVALTAGRSVAIDPRAIPLGAPIWLSTTEPLSSQPMDRLMMAQDTGGAIRGNVRADVYFGLGDVAGRLAGKMKQRGQIWVLLPKAIPAS